MDGTLSVLIDLSGWIVATILFFRLRKLSMRTAMVRDELERLTNTIRIKLSMAEADEQTKQTNSDR